MKFKLPIVLVFSLITLSLIAQDEHDHEDDHHEEHHHEHHGHEFGVAASPVYFLNEMETSFALHFHYIYHIPNSEFGVGLGYEQIFDEHEHKTIGVVGSYRLTHNWAVHLSPGITFEKDEDGFFALHAETTYEWEFDFLHVGPALEFAYDPEDIHISFGVHVGIGF